MTLCVFGTIIDCQITFINIDTVIHCCIEKITAFTGAFKGSLGVDATLCSGAVMSHFQTFVEINTAYEIFMVVSNITLAFLLSGTDASFMFKIKLFRIELNTGNKISYSQSH